MPRTRGQKLEVEQAQNYTDEKVGRSVPSWVADGNELSAELKAGATPVAHRLGRSPSGWIVMRLQYSGAPAPVVSEVASDDKTLTLVHTGPNAVKLKLWVW